MKKIVFLIGFVAVASFTAKAQDLSKIDLSSRPADHLMIQFGADKITGAPDSIKTSGFSRHFNIYMMYDKPFKSNKKYSVAFGGGLGTSNIFFDNHTVVGIKSPANTLMFTHLDSTANHFAKTKLTFINLQIPVELRYYSNPANPGKSWKFAVGAKAGLMIDAYTKSKNYEDRYGNSIYGKTYIEKESNKRFFNTTDVSLTGRVGYGIFSLHTSYQFNGVIRDGYGPIINKFSMGFTISGL
jgi:hypothetical protein